MTRGSLATRFTFQLDDAVVNPIVPSPSWKVKRVANDPRVTLQPSDSRGRVRDGSVAVSGTAVASQADYERVFALVLAKYKLAARAIKAYGKLAKLLGKGSGIDTAMIVTLDETS